MQKLEIRIFITNIIISQTKVRNIVTILIYIDFTAAYLSVINVLLFINAEARDLAPSSPILLPLKLE